MASQSRPPVIAIEGLDGSGKSHTTRQAALHLSEAHPHHRINVLDSDGVHVISHGQIIESHFGFIEQLKPNDSMPKLGKVALLGAFFGARRYTEHIGRSYGRTDLVLSVRDSLRIDPATYLAVLNQRMGHISPQHRLEWLDHTTRLTPPDVVVYLNAETAQVGSILAQRPNPDYFETPERLQTAHDELERVIYTHGQLFGSALLAFEALQPQTIDNLTSELERFLGHTAVAA